MALVLKQIDTYQRLQLVANTYRSAPDKAAFMRRHGGELLLFESTKKALTTIQSSSGEPLNLTALRAEYEALVNEKKKLFTQYREARQQLGQMDTVKRNVEQLLRVREPSRDGFHRE